MSSINVADALPIVWPCQYPNAFVRLGFDCASVPISLILLTKNALIQNVNAALYGRIGGAVGELVPAISGADLDARKHSLDGSDPLQQR